MGKFFESRKRKHDALERSFADLREDGNLTPYTKNAAIADNEIAWEIGAFEDAGDDISDDTRDGLIIRTRRDSLAAALHSASLGEQVTRMEAALTDMRRVVLFIAVVVAAIAVKVLFG